MAFKFNINYKAVENHFDVKLKGNEIFTELLQIEKNLKEKNERSERIKLEDAKAKRIDAEILAFKNF